MSFKKDVGSDCMELAIALLASGIDPKKSVLYIQSQVPQHAELTWLLSCISSQHWLNRMTQYKDKKNKMPSLGLFTYPILMAADVMLFK
jgi:tryptophanyl-tRNA synthetase